MTMPEPTVSRTGCSGESSMRERMWTTDGMVRLKTSEMRSRSRGGVGEGTTGVAGGINAVVLVADTSSGRGVGVCVGWSVGRGVGVKVGGRVAVGTRDGVAVATVLGVGVRVTMFGVRTMKMNGVAVRVGVREGVGVGDVSTAVGFAVRVGVGEGMAALGRVAVGDGLASDWDAGIALLPASAVGVASCGVPGSSHAAKARSATALTAMWAHQRLGKYSIILSCKPLRGEHGARGSGYAWLPLVYNERSIRRLDKAVGTLHKARNRAPAGVVRSGCLGCWLRGYCRAPEGWGARVVTCCGGGAACGGCGRGPAAPARPWSGSSACCGAPSGCRTAAWRSGSAGAGSRRLHLREWLRKTMKSPKK